MKKGIDIVIIFCVGMLLLIAGCSPNRQAFEPSKIELQWKLIRNTVQNSQPEFVAALTISNGSGSEIPPSGWKLYFNLRYHGHDLTSSGSDFEIKHVSGELFYLQPAGSFKGLSSGESITVEYRGKKRVANFQDVPTGFFWVNDHDSQTAIQLKKPTVITNDKLEKLPFADAAAIYKNNSLIEEIPTEELPRVFPTASSYNDSEETLTLDASTTISADDSFDKEANYLKRELKKVLDSEISITTNSNGKGSIVLRRNNLPAEAYHLKVGSDGILIEAGDAAGIFYGIQSLKTLFPPLSWKSSQPSITISGVEVHDAPRFPFRAFMLDVARNFHSKQEVLKVLEVMSLYKLNVFHFHLSDDEGWRLEIPGLPELTEVGATRGYPFEQNERLHPSYGSGPSIQSSGNGFYTVADYIEIVRYAAERHIRVVPEIESPGHARAAIKAMESRYNKYLDQKDTTEANRYLLHDPGDQSVYISNQYFKDNVMNVALPSTYVFIEKVIDEVIAMHQQAAAPLTAIHMAGDEVPFGSWEKSPRVSAFLKEHPAIKSTKDIWGYYFEEIKTSLKERGLSVYGWQELVVGTQTEHDSKHAINPAFVQDDLQLDAWWNMYGNEDIPYKLANAGYKTVLTCFDQFYFNLAYQRSFDEPGDAWIGYLDIDRVYSFIPYDYYRNFTIDVRGNPHPENFFLNKEKLTKKGKSNIMGIQGALWGENLVTSELMEYMLMPRLLALAERAWANDPAWATEANINQSDKLFRQSWSVFVNTLGKRELPRLDYYYGGINYRIPAPGAIVLDGSVIANIQLPGFVIRYTTDGTEPGTKSTVYTKPVDDKKLIKLRAFDLRGRSSHTVSITNETETINN